MKRRLRNRGTESDEQFQIRLATAVTEYEQKDLYDIHIVNESLEKAKNELLAILQKG
jgi:guanylate kinase